MKIVIYSSVDVPIEAVTRDLSAGDVVVYAVATSKETPPINIVFGDELRSANVQGPDVAHHKVKVGDNAWYDCYTYGVVVDFDLDSASELVGEALRLWRADGKLWRYSAQLQDS